VTVDHSVRVKTWPTGKGDVSVERGCAFRESSKDPTAVLAIRATPSTATIHTRVVTTFVASDEGPAVRDHPFGVLVATGRIGVPVVGLLLSLWIVAGTGVAATPLPACRMTDFTMGIGPTISEATGQNTLALRLVNRNGATCFLRGYPTVSAYDRRGMIPFLIRHGGDQMLTSRPPTRVVVRQNGAAFVLLNRYRCDLGDRRTATRVSVRRAGATRAESVSVKLAVTNNRLRYCGEGDPGSTLTVSPFEPTVRAALHG
jgi:hypothetical protein